MARPTADRAGGGSRRAIARGRLAGFDGLRAVAALAIVVLHVTSATGAVGATGFGQYFARLDVGVTIFFLISAFLLYRPFVDAHLHGRDSIALRVFWWRRGLRIYPGVLGRAHRRDRAVPRDALHGFWDYARHYLLVQIYQPKYGLAGIVPTWTLAVEVSFYAALPLYAWVLGAVTQRQRRSRGASRSRSRAPALLYAFGLAWHLGVVTTRGTNAVSARWLPAMSDWFALGILLAVLCERGAGVAGRGVAAASSSTATPTPRSCSRSSRTSCACNIGLPVNGTSGTVRAGRARRGPVRARRAVPRRAGRARAHAPRASACACSTAGPRSRSAPISYGIFLWHYVWLGQARVVGRVRLDPLGAHADGARR